MLALAAVLLTGWTRVQTQRTAPVEDAEVAITQFYAEPVVPRGETTKLCYGVANAKSVRLDPPTERVWPAVARCIEVDPRQHGKFTLTAEDASGRSVARTVEIRVGPPRAKIIEVSINKTEAKAGEAITLCYKAANVAFVDAGPGKWLLDHSNDKGCLIDKPSKTTTYHVRVGGASGQSDLEQVTVKVRP